MVVYNFKRIQPVPNSEEFIDIVLTRTQRKTPTIVHEGYDIVRIRNFYTRKIKFTQQTIGDRLTQILSDFPRLDDIHPFYADLMNILYDRDHYKLALGQLNTVKRIAQTVSRDFIRMMKYGDSLYRCKQLKRSALGRMCTLIKKLRASLSYLEEVRKHLSRLPSLDPSCRTIILTGYPNVGKSSLMNKLTNANVEVQPYAFTTKSLYVGHLDYQFLSWQVIDTPGLLDHPLSERNTIEMQAITALAHLQCCIVFMIDLSESGGYSIADQIKLFESIKPLFVHKDVLIVCNKIDLVAFDALPQVDQELINALSSTTSSILFMSTKSNEGIMTVKKTACDLLLASRQASKSSQINRLQQVASLITIVEPRRRDDRERPAFIPQSVLDERGQVLSDNDNNDNDNLMKKKKTTNKVRDVNNNHRSDVDEHGDTYTPAVDYRKYYLLKDDEWKHDVMPELFDGKNVIDFIDGDIIAKLEQLELEEDEREKADAAEMAGLKEIGGVDLDQEEEILLTTIHQKEASARAKHTDLVGSNHSLPTRAMRSRGVSLDDVQGQLEAVGLPSNAIIDRMGEEGVKHKKRIDRMKAEISKPEDIDDDGDGNLDEVRLDRLANMLKRKKRSHSADGLEIEAKRVPVLADKSLIQTHFQRLGLVNETDRRQYQKLHRHLVQGKMSNGTSRSR